MKWLIFLMSGFAGIIFSATAQSVLESAEATVQSGTNASSDIDEVAAGFLHIKYHAPLTLARKVYFQFDLTGQSADTNSSATFSIFFLNTYTQRIQLWALNQPTTNFSANLTWNTAPANDTNSNSLLTNGLFTATPVGASVLVPVSGTTPYSFTLSRLGDFLFGNKITLCLSGVDDPSNNAAGLRLLLDSARFSFSSTTNVPPPDTNHFDVYLVGGQSNMDGRGNNSDLTGNKSFWNQPQSNVWIYYANPVNQQPTNPTYNTGWQTLQPGFSVPPSFSGALPSSRFGPELSFAKAITDANPNRRVALIKVTQGGTSLSSDWKPSTGYMYATLTNMAGIALQHLTSAANTYTVRGMIWHQGESDSSGSALANYETNMTQFIAAIRRDLGIANLPFVVGEVATNKVEELRAAQLRLSENIPWVGFASADALVTVDGTHFNSDGVLLIGQRFAAGLETPPLKFISWSATTNTLVFSASGLARSSCRLLASTNLTLSSNSWSAISTNSFNGSGEFRSTNGIFGSREIFFRLQSL